MREWRQMVIASHSPMAIPVMTHPGIEALGFSVREAIQCGEKQAQAIVYLADQFPTAAACTAMDLTVEAEAFGASVVFPEDEIASVSSRLLHNEAEIEQLDVPPLTAGRIPEYLKANILAARQIHDRPLFAGCIGPFSLAGRLYGMSEIMILMYNNPVAAHLLLEKCTLFLAKYCAALKQTGANGVLMAEPAAGLLSNDDCLQFSSKYVRRIVDQVQDQQFMLILHNCGNQGQCTEAMVASGAEAFHFGNKCDMAEVMSHIPSDKLGMGNIDPVSVFKEGDPDAVKKATRELLEQCKDYPNFVISSGCDTPPHTPSQNIAAFFEALRSE